MLSFTKRVDYALMALAYLARCGNGGQASAREISESCGIPHDLLAKILQQLHRGGLLKSTRGMAGGYSLSRPADEVNLRQALEIVEGPVAMLDCLKHSTQACQWETLCQVRTNLQRLQDQLVEGMEECTIADLTSDAFPPVKES